jgi:hypothetical protein
MDTVIRDDFADFKNNCELFNSDVKLYKSQGGTLIYEGKGIYDHKPNAVPNEDGMVVYDGHKSILTLSKSELTFVSGYEDLKAYYVEITDNDGTYNYWISSSSLSKNVGSIFCYLKDTEVKL